MTKQKPIVGYLRVSTRKQRQSGLGLEAQQEALRNYAAVSGGRVLATYTETESGKRDDNRPELHKAIAHARRSGAVLVIAKLDRLSRNAAFLFALQDAGVDFECCDQPNANKLTIRILAVFAQDERERISQRTKDALAAYKRRGGLLGASRPECRNLTKAARKRGQKAASEAHRRLTDDAYADLLPTMIEWRKSGWTQQEIANELNELGHTTRRGCPWSQVQVGRVLARVNG